MLDKQQKECEKLAQAIYDIAECDGLSFIDDLQYMYGSKEQDIIDGLTDDLIAFGNGELDKENHPYKQVCTNHFGDYLLIATKWIRWEIQFDDLEIHPNGVELIGDYPKISAYAYPIDVECVDSVIERLEW